MSSSEIKLECKECGRPVEYDFSFYTLVIRPCESCISKADTDAYDRGYDDGYQACSDDKED